MPIRPFIRIAGQTDTAPGQRLHALLLALAIGLSSGGAARADGDAPETIEGHAVVEIAAGLYHSCARVETGAVFCWGLNSSGQLGSGNYSSTPSPVQVQGLTNAVQVVTGREHSCALRNNGRVRCWGNNTYHQLGDGTVVSRTDTALVPGLTEVTRITAGEHHTCARRSTGRVFCWGLNADGQLGDGSTENRSTPVRVEGVFSSLATDIGAGARHTCLLRQNALVYCFGENKFGQLGDGTLTGRVLPQPVSNLTNVQQLAMGLFHSCALRGSGRVFCWGRNVHGALGDGTTTNRNSPGIVPNLTGVAHVAAGGRFGSGHSCAVRTTGRIFCWGSNEFGQLGDGTTIDRLSPERVLGPLMVNATQVTAGGAHSCGIRPNGRAYCWGWNTWGQIGDGSANDRLAPVRVMD